MTFDRNVSQADSFSTLEDDCGFKFQRKKRVSLAAAIEPAVEQPQVHTKKGSRSQSGAKAALSTQNSFESIPEKQVPPKANKQKASVIKQQQVSEPLQQALISSKQLLEEKRRRRSSLGLKLGSARRPSSIGLSLSQCTLSLVSFSSFTINRSK